MRLTSSCLNYMTLCPFLLRKHVFSSLNELKWSQRLQIRESALPWSPTLLTYCNPRNSPYLPLDSIISWLCKLHVALVPGTPLPTSKRHREEKQHFLETSSKVRCESPGGLSHRALWRAALYRLPDGLASDSQGQRGGRLTSVLPCSQFPLFHSSRPLPYSLFSFPETSYKINVTD